MTPGKNIPELFTDLVEQLSTLFRKEIQLAKTEASEKVQQATNAMVYLATGGVLLLGGFLMLLAAITVWMVVFGVPLEWATLIVAAVVLIIGAIVVKKGMNDLKANNLTPKRTVTQLRADTRTAKEQF